MMGLWRAWRSFWFPPEPAGNLCLGRAIFFGLLFVLYLPVDYAAWADVPGEFWQPVSFFAWSPALRLSAAWLQVLGVLFKTALLLSALGLWTRSSVAVAVLSGMLVLGMPNNFGKVHHTAGPVVLFMAILALSRCGDRYSLDSLWSKAAAPPSPSAEYGWPRRAVCAVIVLIYFSAGLSKLLISGWSWASADNISNMILSHAHYHVSGPSVWTWAALLVAQSAFLSGTVGVASLLIELTCPLALFSRRAALLLVPALILMQLGIRITMGPDFSSVMFAHVFWIPWPRLLGGRERPLAQIPPASI
jgi:hypothetical protein